MKEDKNEIVSIENIENEIDDIDLVIFLVGLATLNLKQYNDRLYSAFLRLKELNILKKDEKKWINHLVDDYDTKIRFTSLDVLEKLKYVTLTDSKKKNIETMYNRNGYLIEEMLNNIISARIVDNFVKENKIEEHLENSSVSLDLIYKVVDFKNELLQFSSENIQNDFCDDVNLYTGIEYIDRQYSKISPGSIVSIIKNKNCSNFIEASIIYNNISREKKNICIMTSSWTTKDIIAKILVLHSQTLDDEKKLSYKDIHNNKEDVQKIHEVYQDFMEKYGSNLQVYCNTSLRIFNIGSFRNLLVTANQVFENTTGHSMDILVIDMIDNFRFEEKGVIECNTDKIIKQYCNLIIREVKLFNGNSNNKLIAIISTNIASRETYSHLSLEFDLKNNENYRDFKVGADILEKYSDLVLVIASNNIRKDYKKLYGDFQIIKTRDSFSMEEPIPMTISLIDCSITYHKFLEESFDSELRLNNMSEFYSQNFFPTLSSSPKNLKST